MSVVATIEQLEAIYGQTNDASTVKVADWVTPSYRVMIEKSPFAALATAGPEGLDCSPRGDLAGFVRIHDEKTFLIPGSGSTLRVNGRAYVSADAELLASFKMDGKAPRSVIVMTVEEIYFQC